MAKSLFILSKRIFALACIAVAFISCDCDCEGEPGTLNPYALFQYEYINEAWGHVHQGWFIDIEGNIGRFELPSEWNEPDTLGFISEEALAANIHQANDNIGTITDTDLITYTGLLTEVNPFDLSELESGSADAGDSFLYGYQWKPSSGRFHRVLLVHGSSVRQTNLDPEAIEITEWLIEVGRDIDPEFQF